MITPSIRQRQRLRFALALVTIATLAACGGGSGDGDTSGDIAVDDPSSGGGMPAAGGDPVGPDGNAAPLPGDIARYGVLNLGDDGVEATELVAAFFALPTPVSAAAFGGALDSDIAECRVVPAGGDTGFTFPSTGFLPVPSGVPVSSTTSISAGETIVLTSTATGTWAELQPSGAIGGTAFYDPAVMLPTGAVPDDLVLDVPGDEFLAFADVTVPSVAPLLGFTDDSNGRTDPGTSFAWTPGEDPGAKIRLSTGSSFFADPTTAANVLCTVPDTGTFAFDEGTRAALGDDFAGGTTSASRVRIDTVSQGEALLIVVRESDATSN